MGKTKTVVISGKSDDDLSGKEAYEKKRREKERKKKQQEEKDKKKVDAVGLKGGERIKVIKGGPVPDKKPATTESAEEDESTESKPKERGKKYKKADKKVDKSKLYSIKDAVKLIKDTSYSKFDGSVELHIKVKKEGLRVKVELPHSTGIEKKIEIADENTIKKLKKGKIDFDILLATKDMMPKLVPFAKDLGPKGLMPNPKQGTLIKDKKEAEKFKGNTLRLKTERKAPVIHTVIGKVSHKQKELVENIQAVLKAIGNKQIVKAHLSATMSPGVKLDTNSI